MGPRCRLPLLAALLFGALCARPASAAHLDVRPRWTVTVTNVTSNWTASEPVTWELATKMGDAHKSLNSGYAVEMETTTSISILSGFVGGYFVLTATAGACGPGMKRSECRRSVTYIVLSDLQASLLGLVAASIATLLLLWFLSCLKPVDPQDKLPCDVRTGKPLRIVDSSYGATAQGQRVGAVSRAS